MSDHLKPSEVPTWATNGERVKPPAEKQAQGFVPRERAGAQYFNWIFNAIGNWAKWLDTVFGRPVSAIAGLRYLALRGDDGTPGIELSAPAGSTCCGEVQWSDPALGEEDKRVAAVSAWVDNGPRLDIHARGPEDRYVGNPRVTVHPEGLEVFGRLDVGGTTAMRGGIKGVMRFAGAWGPGGDDGEGVIEMPAGERSIDVAGKSWVGIQAHDTHAELVGFRGGELGQLLVCEVIGTPGNTLASLTIKNMTYESGVDMIGLRTTSGEDLRLEPRGLATIVCVFFRSGLCWRLLAVNI